jgi:RNA polymerase sigma-70 factor (ECF subfamily)
MTDVRPPDSDELLRRVERGDGSAITPLLERHRDRLRRMLNVHMDPRVRRRVDPSDVIQEALLDASQRLPQYARERPIPFYPWLRNIAWERLLDVQKAHLKRSKRTLRREQNVVLTDDSLEALARQLIDTGTNPPDRILRSELRQRIRTAVDQLAEDDRQVLVLRHLEQLPVRDIAAVLGLSESAIKMRCLRALTRLRDQLDTS